jgi:hypothetical protein
MKTDTTILSQSLRIIVNDLIDEEGVVSGAILEAADRLDELHGDNIHLNAQNNKMKSDIKRLTPTPGEWLEKFKKEFDETLSKMSDQDLIDSFKKLGCDVETINPQLN